ncbi:MAG TPA: inorganic diphosphatase [Silvibacterium sp.]|nr:inorganic diphosphatase [Silvibacterium sp.]
MKRAAKKPPGKEKVVAVVETPRGCRNKYKFDEQTGRMKLSKVMPEGMMFPYDFGFIPDTQSEDGDPLDILILSDASTFPGCQLDCRLIGVIKANQREKGEEKRNDRVIAVAEASVLYASVNEISQLEPALLKQIEEFFVNYQKVRDIEYTIIAREGPHSAEKILTEASRRMAPNAVHDKMRKSA